MKLFSAAYRNTYDEMCLVGRPDPSLDLRAAFNATVAPRRVRQRMSDIIICPECGASPLVNHQSNCSQPAYVEGNP